MSLITKFQFGTRWKFSKRRNTSHHLLQKNPSLEEVLLITSQIVPPSQDALRHVMSSRRHRPAGGVCGSCKCVFASVASALTSMTWCRSGDAFLHLLAFCLWVGGLPPGCRGSPTCQGVGGTSRSHTHLQESHKKCSQHLPYRLFCSYPLKG